MKFHLILVIEIMCSLCECGLCTCVGCVYVWVWAVCMCGLCACVGSVYMWVWHMWDVCICGMCACVGCVHVWNVWVWDVCMCGMCVCMSVAYVHVWRPQVNIGYPGLSLCLISLRQESGSWYPASPQPSSCFYLTALGFSTHGRLLDFDLGAGIQAPVLT